MLLKVASLHGMIDSQAFELASCNKTVWLIMHVKWIKFKSRQANVFLKTILKMNICQVRCYFYDF